MLGLQGATGSGKTMLAPRYLLSWLQSQNHPRSCVCLVQDSVYSARRVVFSLVEHFRWQRDRIHLRTSVDKSDRFRTNWTQLTVINYGILWEWMKSEHPWTRKYGGIILDESAFFRLLER